MTRIQRLKLHISQALGADRPALRRDLQRIEKRLFRHPSAEGDPQALSALEHRIQRSIRRRQQRIEQCPRVEVNPGLPIADSQAEIIDAIGRHPVVIISGETGSGKTTQLPKLCLAAGRGIDGKIGCTQPRRIAATTVARRIAEELGESMGASVGYKIRFKDRTPRDAFIKIMTDGILLAEAQNDRFLNEYDTLIVDEAHERSLNIDFILGLLKTLLKRRKNLKIIITSATIDTEKFARAFDNAPVIEVSGRMYPVEVRYMEDGAVTPENGDATHVETAVSAVDRLVAESHRGDILVFMPTEQDIRETCDLLAARNYRNITVYPLFARLAGREQARVFSSRDSRKIIVATNVAETSITIPGIKYVVDTGLARIARYSPRTRTKALPVEPVSRSSADQRMGRCGRVAKGVCIRLFSEEDYLGRPLYTPPEILRTNLAEVILRMMALKLGDVAAFPFIDPPADKSIQDGFQLLRELGAIKPSTGKGAGANRFVLTGKGRVMAKVPLDPRLSRMLIESADEGCLEQLVIIASALSIPDPRERPHENTDAADRAHHTFEHPNSDFLTLLTIWDRFRIEKRKRGTVRKLKRFCSEHFLSYKRMREWQDIHRQINLVLEESRMGSSRTSSAAKPFIPAADAGTSDPTYAAIHRSILSGFLSNIALKKEKNFFTAARSREAMIFPGSGLFNHAGQWIVAAEMVATTRLFARTVARIDPAWLEPLAKSHCRYTYLDPHWERNREEVVAKEQVSLFGLIMESGRPVSFGRIDPEAATDIFVRSALVDRDIKKPLPFMVHNHQLIDDVTTLEDKLRRRDILIDENDIQDFYRSRLERVYDIRSLKRLLREKKGDQFLRLNRDDLMRYMPGGDEIERYPERIAMGGDQFQCEYRFDPGAPKDGVTVKIPSSVASCVTPEPLDWLVPGLLKEKVTELIKGLPKTHRRRLVPVPDTVDIITREMPRSGRALISELGDFILKRFGVDIPAAAWPTEDLPDHLRMRLSITDAHGHEVAGGRDPAILARLSVAEAPEAGLAAARKQWERSGLTNWEFGDQPESVSLQGKKQRQWTQYPGLAVTGEEGGQRVDLRLFSDRSRAVGSHVKGVAVLLSLRLSSDLKYLKKVMTLPAHKKSYAAGFGGIGGFRDCLTGVIKERLLLKNIRTQQAFETYAVQVKAQLLEQGRLLLASCLAVLEAYGGTREVLRTLSLQYIKAGPVTNFLTHLETEIRQLVPENFPALYEPGRMPDLVRFMNALAVRARRGVVDLEKDRIKAQKVKKYSDALSDLLKTLSPSVSEEKRRCIEAFFWMVEEYKVSLFAQEIKTGIPVSEKRLDKRLKEIERMV
jgi:ATP-dependent RNA helicase HrpA